MVVVPPLMVTGEAMLMSRASMIVKPPWAAKKDRSLEVETVTRPVGKAVGTLVGRGIGTLVGRGVGRAVGRGVGRAVGRAVGGDVGSEVGRGVGNGVVGRGVGNGVGCGVGYCSTQIHDVVILHDICRPAFEVLDVEEINKVALLVGVTPTQVVVSTLEQNQRML